MPELRTIRHREFNRTVGRQADINAHVANKNNPHETEASQLTYNPPLGSPITAANINDALNQISTFIFPGGEHIVGISNDLIDSDVVLVTSGAVFRALENIDAEISIQRTKIHVLEKLQNTYIFDLTNSNTEYSLVGDTIELGTNEESFQEDKKLVMLLNGVELDKINEIIWISNTTFSYFSILDNTDILTIRRIL